MYFRNGGSACCAVISLIVKRTAKKGRKLFMDFIKLMIM
jgi:hypothetical protein